MLLPGTEAHDERRREQGAEDAGEEPRELVSVEPPEIDSIARNGVRFTNGYVSAALCSPSRAGLLTGRYQQRFGHEHNRSYPDSALPLSERTLADRDPCQVELATR